MIRTLLISAIVATAMVAPAHAGDEPTYTVQQCTEILNGLGALSDGYTALDKDGKQVKLQYKLGRLRIDIANNITLLRTVIKTADDARVALIKELLPENQPDPSSPEWAKFAQTDAYKRFMTEYNSMVNAPLPGTTIHLARIKEAALNVGDDKDMNPIPPVVLSQLAPILDK